MICFPPFPIPGGCRSVSGLTQMYIAVGWTMGTDGNKFPLNLGCDKTEERIYSATLKIKTSIYLVHSVYQCSRVK